MTEDLGLASNKGVGLQSKTDIGGRSLKDDRCQMMQKMLG